MSNTAIEEQDYDRDLKVDIGIWKRLFRYVLSNKRACVLSVVTNMVIALIDIAYPLMSRYAIDNFIGKGTTQGILPFILLYFVLITAQAFGVYSFVAQAGRIEMNVSFDIRQQAFKKLQELSFSFYDKTAVGYLMARMVSDVGRLSELLSWGFVDLLWASTYVVGVMIAMLLLNWKLALLALVVIPPLAVISLYFKKRILQYQRKVRKTNSRITGAFNEGIMGAVTTKTLVREKANYGEFSELSGTMRQASVKAAVWSAIFMPIVMFLGSIGTGIALYKGGVDVLIGAIGFGTLSAFVVHDEPSSPYSSSRAYSRSPERAGERRARNRPDRRRSRSWIRPRSSRNTATTSTPNARTGSPSRARSSSSTWTSPIKRGNACCATSACT